MNGDDPIAAFRQEAEDLLEQIEQDLLDLEQNLSDAKLVDAVFRGLHTLKGSGAMFGFDALAGFTHHCETAFDRIRKGRASANAQIVGVILSARDHMRALLNGNTPALEQAGEAILGALGQAVAAGADVQEAAALSAGPGDGWKLVFRLPANAMANGVNPLSLLAELRELGATEVRGLRERIPPFDDLEPTDCHLGWEVLLPGSLDRGQIEDVFIFVMDEMELTLERAGTPACPSPETGPESVSGAGTPPSLAATTARPAESVRVPAERLDELMNRVGELVIAQSRLAQIANQTGAVNEVALRAIAEDIDRLSSELRDTTMILRMMQVGTLFGRFRRLVHDLSGETGKQISFIAEGEGTEVDKTVIERLADPLVHLIRNSCDHGLEPPEERLAAGKAAAGTITVSAQQTGGEVVICVADDGRGIDRGAVRAKAEAQGLLAEDAAISDQDLLQMIFRPGFSTAASVTNLSGRGVGMDVVKKTIESLRGTIRVTSSEGLGTRIMLHLPLTLAIIECMIVRVGDARYAIPLSAVEECLELPAAEAAGKGGRAFLDVRGDLVPYLRLRALFQTDWPLDLHQKVVIVSADTARVGLVVDQIIGNAQTVIKPLSRFHARLGAFAGATIMGDGTVALILDVADLLAREATGNRAGARKASGEAA